MEIVALTKYAQLVDAYEKLKDTFADLASRVNVDAYLEKICNHAEVLAAVDEQKNICGLVAAYMNDPASACAYITLIGVDCRKKRSGIGSKLFESIVKKAQLRKMKYLKLEVNKKNSGAIEFYKKHRMEIIGDATEQSYYMGCEI